MIRPSARRLKITADGQEETSGDRGQQRQGDKGLDVEQLTDDDKPGRSGRPSIVGDNRSWIDVWVINGIGIDRIGVNVGRRGRCRCGCQCHPRCRSGR